jgi:hypothetical protein
MQGGFVKAVSPRFLPGVALVLLCMPRLQLQPEGVFGPRECLLIYDHRAKCTQQHHGHDQSASNGTAAMHAPAAAQRSRTSATFRSNHPWQSAVPTDAALSNSSYVTLTPARWGDELTADRFVCPQRSLSISILANKNPLCCRWSRCAGTVFGRDFPGLWQQLGFILTAHNGL